MENCKKYLMVDTETANGLDCPIMYDFGYAVIDDNGSVYEQGSYIIADIFFDKELMSSAYYADKVPQYLEDINNGLRKLITLKDLRQRVKETMAKYEIADVIAHNARFDYCSTNTTQRYMTSSKWRYFFPYGISMVDTLKMARKVLGQDSNYKEFCMTNGYLTKRNQCRYTAEIIYRYISNDNGFIEKHTGLEDVMIEKEIFNYCRKFMAVEDGYLW